MVKTAEAYNEPGRFTTLIGFEWTSLVKGNNLHRNVIFRDGGDKAGQVVPYTTQAPIGSTARRNGPNASPAAAKCGPMPVSPAKYTGPPGPRST